MEFKVLGPLEVRRDGEIVPVGGPKPRAVLAFLLLHANLPVSADRLAAALWGDDAAPAEGLRRPVHPDHGGGWLPAAPAARRARLGPLPTVARQGRRTLAGGRPEDAARILGDALGLWRGPAVANLAFEPFAQTEIAR